MISYGKNITSAADPLQLLPAEQLFNLIRKPDSELITLIEQLRLVLNIDGERYKILKRKLPYFVCAKFLPAVRLSSNFISIEYFVLDIDHISQKQMFISDLKAEIIKDKRVLLAFESPSADGLKLMFKLDKPLFDLVQYKMFYKVFCGKFSNEYNLAQVLDNRTNDATRATFLSADSRAFYNAHCQRIKIEEYVDYENELEWQQVEYELKQDAKQKPTEPILDEPDARVELSAELLAQLRQKLNPRIKAKEEVKTWFVPEQVDKLLGQIEAKIESSGLKIKEIVAIHYGRKIVFESGFLWAEVNIFYGKRGYSAVKTPKKGSDAALADLCFDVINSIINYEKNE